MTIFGSLTRLKQSRPSCRDGPYIQALTCGSDLLKVGTKTYWRVGTEMQAAGVGVLMPLTS